MIATFKKSKKWLVLAVFILALAGLTIACVRKQQSIDQSIAAIENLGGTINRRSDIPTQQVVDWLFRLGLRETGSWVERASRRFSPVVSLILPTKTLTGAGFEHLKGLVQLETLHLIGTQIRDAGLVHLKELPKLTRLYLNGTQITDGGLAYLKDLTSLTDLELSGTKVTDAGLVHFKGLSHLGTLNLSETQITDAGLVHLTQLTNLRLLYLNRTH